MASIISKKVNGGTYYYLREMARVGGKPKMVSERYLGKAEDIEAAMSGAQVLPERTRHLAFGDLAAAISVLRRIGLAEVVDQVLCGRRGDAAASLGTYLELLVANRVVAPCSKLAFGDWWQTTAGDRLVKLPPAALDHRRLWDAMDAFDDAALQEIERQIVRRVLSEFEISAEGLVLDMTNVSTYIDSGNERNTVARRGHAKNKRHDLRVVGLSLVVTRDGAIPIASHTYPGNRPDVTQFKTAIETLSSHLAGVTEKEALTVVFDAGMDSFENLELLANLGFHLVASVPPHQHLDLLKVPADDYVVFDATSLSGVRAFETEQEVLGRALRVVVTHSEEFHQKQSRGFAQTLAKATRQLADLARRLNGGKARKPRRAVEAEIAEICRPRWLARVLRVDLTGERPADLSLSFAIDQAALDALEEEVFGKRILITDRREWEIAEVIVAYRSQWQVEHGFRQLKDPDHVAVQPMFHWTDQKITVHLFCCVLALGVMRLLAREARRAGLELSPGEVLRELGRIEETVLVYPSTGGRPRARRVLTERSPLQEQLFSLFGLELFAPPT